MECFFENLGKPIDDTKLLKIILNSLGIFFIVFILICVNLILYIRYKLSSLKY